MSTRRGPKGDGSVYQRKDGRWTACLKIDGKDRYQYGKSKAEARQALAALRVQRDTGGYVPTSKQSLRQFLEAWLEDVSPNLRYGSVRRYQLDVDRICTELGDVKLQTLTPQRIQKFYTASNPKLGAATIEHMHTVLKAALTTAVNWKLIAANPASAVRPRRAERRQIHPFSKDELQLLLDLAAEAEPRWVALFDMLATTGMRIGEALGLTWTAIDWEHRTIKIYQQLQYRNGEAQPYWLVNLKAPRKNPFVRISVGTTQRLQVHRTLQKREWLEHGNGNDRPELVFTRRTGRPLDDKTVWSVLQRLCDTAGLERRRTHDLRHTAATLMLQDGRPAQQVAEILGHSSPKTTMGTYAHVLEEMHDEAADMWDRVLLRKG